jgi:O-acetyl-ADP-ribose deacetylase (regulator of RNase III)
MQLKLINGDITQVSADAIVNAANNELWMGSGVAGAIKRVGGKEIETEALENAPIGHGEAIATTAGKLKAKYVIHAAGMRADGYISPESLHDSILNSLLLAEKLQLKSIAFPAIGTGVAGFPLDECAKIMITVCKDFDYKSLKTVLIVLYSDEAFDIFIDEANGKALINL